MPKGSDDSEGFIFLEGDEVDEEVQQPPSPKVTDGTSDEKSSCEVTDCCDHDSTTIPLESTKKSINSPVNEVEIYTAELVSDGVHRFSWPIRGMDCPDCAMKASSATNKNPAVTACKITHADGMVHLEMDLGKGDLAKANRILSSLGHEPDVDWMRLKGVTLESVLQRQNCTKQELLRLMSTVPGILDSHLQESSILIQYPTEMSRETLAEHRSSLERITGKYPSMAKGEVSGLSSEHQRLVGASLALALLPVVIGLQAIGTPAILLAGVGISGTLIGGLRMFSEAIASIKNRVLGFQILTTMAVIGAALLQHWPEALMVVLPEPVSGHLESSALLRARSAMQGGLDRLPRTARVVPTGAPSLGKISTTTFSTGLTPASSLEPARPVAEDQPIDLVNPGMLVEVRSGELIPVDGIIAEGIGQIDRAPLTGESTPIRVETGDFIEAGLVLLRGPIVMEVTAVGEDTKLSELIDRVHTYRDKPPRLQSSVELFTKYWVPLVLLGGLASALIFGDFVMMLLLWVVACPCALLLAAPIPHATALANASHHGVIARGGDVLERTARIDLALLDKTGTLTSGNPSLESIVLSDDVELEEALSLAAGLETRSNHPYAATILAAADAKLISYKEVSSISDGGAGVSGKLGRSIIRLGSESWLIESGISVPKSLSHAAEEARNNGFGIAMLSKIKSALALFTFNNDDLRPGAQQLVNDLRELGIAVELLSGDSQPAVEALGKRLGIDTQYCRGDIDPNGKAVWTERRSQALCTLMAGDGFNDAAALAVSDVGVAVGSGESVNLEAADVLIPSNDPRIISRLIKLSRKTRFIVQLNLVISFLVTVILVISVVAKWHESLALGVFVHEASALITLLNGVWLADEGMSRMGMLTTLFKQLFEDTREAWKSLYLMMKSPK